MNRQIEFRGLRTDCNEWVYGSYFNGLDWADFIIENAGFEHRVRVIPETVGQFTGLTDKNGVKIFEGDIIKLDDILCPITFLDGGFQMITNENQGKSACIQDRVKHFEVIGNVHQNPELLKD